MASTASVILRKGGNAFQVFGFVSACLLSFCFTSACQTSCGNSNQQPIPYVDGKTHVDNGVRIYESTPITGEWLDFQSYRRFKLVHNLCTLDYNPYLYIAFSSNPAPYGDAGDTAIASGDSALIENQGLKSLQVLNATCSPQYLYVKIVASAPVNSDDEGLGCAGANQ
jgi:hypothetical protein